MLERRKNLLYQSRKRRSVLSIVLLTLAALAVGIVIALLIKQSMHIEIGCLPEESGPRLTVAGAAPSPERRFAV